MEVLRKVVFPDATDVELRMVLSMAKQLDLDPRRGQIRAFRVGGRPVISVGIDGYRVIAEHTGEYDGQDPPKLETAADGKLISATVTVYRRGMGRGVSATAWWDEYARDTPPWRNMPRVMLSKVAEALALRKAFPRGLSGTYTPEEMDQATHATPLSPPRVELPGEATRRRGRPRQAVTVQPSAPEPEPPAQGETPLPDIRAWVDEIRAYLGDTSIPQTHRDRVLSRMGDLLSTWAVPTVDDLAALAGKGSAELAHAIESDLRGVVALTRGSP